MMVVHVPKTLMALTYRKFDAATDGTEGLLLNPASLMRAMASDIVQIANYWQAVKYLVLTNLTVRYQRSVLGFCWVFLNPLLCLAIYAVIFSTLMGRPLATYTVYIFSGMIPYLFFSTSLSVGAVSYVKNQSLIRKTYIPRLLFPLTDMISQLVNMGFAMVVLFLLLQGIGAGIHPQLIMFPLALLALILFTFGLMLILMVATTYFRDIEHILNALTRLLYFATPIIWEPTQFIGKRWYFDAIVYGNPLTYMLKPFQDMFRFGQWTDLRTWSIVLILATATPLIGFIIYKKHEHKLIFRI